jgi:hypothetical protein
MKRLRFKNNETDKKRNQCKSSLSPKCTPETKRGGRIILFFIFKWVFLRIRGFLIISVSPLKWRHWIPRKGYSWIWWFAFLTQSLLAFAKCLALYSSLSFTMIKVRHFLLELNGHWFPRWFQNILNSARTSSY